MFGFGKTYIFVSVYFQPYGKSYAYRTDDKTIKVNDTVIVPATGGETAALLQMSKNIKRTRCHSLLKRRNSK